jgi:hypothetical protein
VRNVTESTKSSRGELYIAVASLLWLMWLVGTLSQSSLRTLSVFLFDLLGSVILIVLSRNLPVAFRITVIGLGLALLSIGVGDGNLSAALLTNTDPNAWLAWRRPFQYFGSLLVVVFTIALPFALARHKLYTQVHPVSVVLGGLITAGVLTSVLILLRKPEVFQIIFFFVACLITAVFLAQPFILRDSDLAGIIRQLAVVFVLVSLGRLILVVLGGSNLGDIIYDFFWCAGISSAAWTLITREP